jgi:hypothetical protein
LSTFELPRRRSGSCAAVLLSAGILFSACGLSGSPAASPPTTVNAMRWRTFSTADLVVSGPLSIDRVHRGIGAQIGDRSVRIGDGWQLAQSEVDRLRRLDGREVIAAISWSKFNDTQLGVVCTSEEVCLGPVSDRDWSAPADAFLGLTQNPQWRREAVRGETGEWNRLVGDVWRKGNEEAIRANVAAVCDAQTGILMARDIAGWYARTLEVDFDAIPSTFLVAGHDRGTVTEVRALAAVVLKSALGIRRTKPWNQSDSEAMARRLWIMTRMAELSGSAAH